MPERLSQEDLFFAREQNAYLRSRRFKSLKDSLFTRNVGGHSVSFVPPHKYYSILDEITSHGSAFATEGKVATRLGRPAAMDMALNAVHEAIRNEQNINAQVGSYLDRGWYGLKKRTFKAGLLVARDPNKRIVGAASLMSNDIGEVGPRAFTTYVNYMGITPSAETVGIGRRMQEYITNVAVSNKSSISFSRAREFGRGDDQYVTIPYERLKERAAMNALQKMESVNQVAAKSLGAIESSIPRTRTIGNIARGIARIR